MTSIWDRHGVAVVKSTRLRIHLPSLQSVCFALKPIVSLESFTGSMRNLVERVEFNHERDSGDFHVLAASSGMYNNYWLPKCKRTLVPRQFWFHFGACAFHFTILHVLSTPLLLGLFRSCWRLVRSAVVIDSQLIILLAAMLFSSVICGLT